MVHCLHPENREAIAHNPPSNRETVGHRLRSCSEAVARIKRRGFNLIDAAIVLALVGLVVGGIWVAAAHFSEEYKVNKTVQDLELIVKKIQNLISYHDAEAIGGSI
jgi:hypothetical protein